MANNQALCEGAQSVLDLIRAGQPLTRAQIHTIEGLCASYANLCEVQTLATARADNAQTLLAQAQTTIAQLRLNLSEAEAMFESEHAQRKQLQQGVYDYRARVINAESACDALLAGDA